MQFTNQTFVDACKASDIDTLAFLYSVGHFPTESMVYIACGRGSLRTVQWLVSVLTPFDLATVRMWVAPGDPDGIARYLTSISYEKRCTIC